MISIWVRPGRHAGASMGFAGRPSWSLQNASISCVKKCFDSASVSVSFLETKGSGWSFVRSEDAVLVLVVDVGVDDDDVEEMDVDDEDDSDGCCLSSISMSVTSISPMFLTR